MGVIVGVNVGGRVGDGCVVRDAAGVAVSCFMSIKSEVFCGMTVFTQVRVSRPQPATNKGRKRQKYRIDLKLCVDIFLLSIGYRYLSIQSSQLHVWK